MRETEDSVDIEAQQRAARGIVDVIENLIRDAQRETRPLEVDPGRSELFECFVQAEQQGLIPNDAESAAAADDDEDECLLSPDLLCRQLARRWGLDMAAREAQAMQTRLPADQLERMRLLWSVMRMWMEWKYAWQRWPEHHGAAADGSRRLSDTQPDDDAEAE